MAEIVVFLELLHARYASSAEIFFLRSLVRGAQECKHHCCVTINLCILACEYIWTKIHNFFRLYISSWNLAGCCKTSVWTFSDSFRSIPFLAGKQWTPKDEYRQNTPTIWKFAPPRAQYNTFGPNFCKFTISPTGSNHYNPTRGVTQCHKNASFFYIRCTHM